MGKIEVVRRRQLEKVITFQRAMAVFSRKK